MGPVSVELIVDNRFHTGAFEVLSRMREGEGGAGAGSLVLGDGKRVALGEKSVVIGRLADCDVVLSDANVSRHHAEVRPKGDGFEVADLGSTNGTRVNGATITGGRRLVDGDEITVGGTRIRFEAS
jgi:pSer/pThr/pTyr-binding forkhead associated (FHA) protein